MRLTDLRYGVDIDGVEENFKVTVNVTNNGVFTATLDEILSKYIKDAEIDHNVSRRNINKIYYSDSSLAGIKKQIGDDIAELTSLTEISRETVIRYWIETRCSYCRKHNDHGDYVPNGGWVEKADNYSGYTWFNGTKSIHAAQPASFGIDFLVDVREKVVKERKSGYRVLSYEKVNSTLENYNLHYLNSICSMKSLNHQFDRKEIPYTEMNAQFFVNLYKFICDMSDKIMDFIDPEDLVKKISSGTKLLE